MIPKHPIDLEDLILSETRTRIETELEVLKSGSVENSRQALPVLHGKP